MSSRCRPIILLLKIILLMKVWKCTIGATGGSREKRSLSLLAAKYSCWEETFSSSVFSGERESSYQSSTLWRRTTSYVDLSGLSKRIFNLANPYQAKTQYYLSAETRKFVVAGSIFFRPFPLLFFSRRHVKNKNWVTLSPVLAGVGLPLPW